MDSQKGPVWLECQFLRRISRAECVIRLLSTGAILQIKLKDPLDITRACLLSALKPADGKVLLGPFEQEEYTDCLVDITWPDPFYSIPPPAPFVRKRLRTSESSDTKKGRDPLLIN